MGFKIINSREYREVCERVAFLESDIDEKNRELEVKEETIKKLKSEVVKLTDGLDNLKSSLVELKAKNDAMRVELEQFKDATGSQAEAAPAEVATPVEVAKKPRAPRKPRAKKDSK